jgi:hypothetical protein
VITKTVTTTASCTSCSCDTWIRFQSTGGLRGPCVLHAAKSMEAIRVKQGTRLPLFPSILIKSACNISILPLLTDVNSCFDVLDGHESCPFANSGWRHIAKLQTSDEQQPTSYCRPLNMLSNPTTWQLGHVHVVDLFDTSSTAPALLTSHHLLVCLLRFLRNSARLRLVTTTCYVITRVTMTFSTSRRFGMASARTNGEVLTTTMTIFSATCTS